MPSPRTGSTNRIMKYVQFVFLYLLLLFLINSTVSAFEYISKNGKKITMSASHHVLDVKLLNNMKPPNEFELEEGKILQCNSCHGIKNIMDTPVDKLDKNDANFLRGGPYKKLTDFCYQCHQKKDHTRNNIHILLDKQGKIIKEKCLYCHEQELKTDQAKSLSEIKLRQAVETICYACHLKTPHLNVIEHLVELKDKKLQQWKLTTKKQNIYMPLTDTGKIMCITCHNPHQQGLLATHLAAAKQVADTDLNKGISYQEHPWQEVYLADKKERLEQFNRNNKTSLTLSYQRIKTEVLLRLPAKNGKLCLSCHSFDD